MSKLKPLQKQNNLERLLLYILQVAPDEFGLLLDKDGFVSLRDLIGAIRDEEGFKYVNEKNLLDFLNRLYPNSPVEISDHKIRLKHDLAPKTDPDDHKEPIKQPKLLYVGLKPTAWGHVCEHGLIPPVGQDFLKLFPTMEAAKKVATRFIPDPVMLTIQVKKAEDSGSIIKAYSPLLFTATAILPQAISGPPVPSKAETTEPKKAEKKEDTPGGARGIFIEPTPNHGKKKGKYQDAPDWKTTTRRDRRRGRE